MKENFYIYILASKRNGTLYVGVSSDLVKRLYQHKNKDVDGFTKKYAVNKLMYYEVYQDARTALYRERCIKEWKREWKVALIEKNNPQWKDLGEEMGIFSSENPWIPAKAGMTDVRNMGGEKEISE